MADKQPHQVKRVVITTIMTDRLKQHITRDMLQQLAQLAQLGVKRK